MSEDEKHTLELLEANHVFPGDFPLTVIAFNRDEVAAVIVREIEEELGTALPDDARQANVSAGAKYVSHRLRVPCRQAAEVVRLYARLRRVDGVVTVL